MQCFWYFSLLIPRSDWKWPVVVQSIATVITFYSVFIYVFLSMPCLLTPFQLLSNRSLRVLVFKFYVLSFVIFRLVSILFRCSSILFLLIFLFFVLQMTFGLQLFFRSVYHLVGYLKLVFLFFSSFPLLSGSSVLYDRLLFLRENRLLYSMFDPCHLSNKTQ